MDSENEWYLPITASIKNPALWEAWKARRDEWVRQNPEIARAWGEADAEESERRAEASRRGQCLTRLRMAGVSERAREIWRAGLQPTHSVQAVETFLGSDKTFLLLMGSAGAGKTVATTAALAKWHGHIVRAVELARLSVYDKDDRARLESLQETGLLVLDDLGAELSHDGFRPMLDELIDIRYGDRAKTIITTNLDSASFKTRYGERISDRIRHDGLVEKCGDKSRRSPTP